MLTVAAIGLNVLDLVMTQYAISIGYVELNPYMASYLSSGLFLPAKLAYSAVLVGLWRIPYPRLVSVALLAVVAILGVIFASNVRTLMFA